MSVTHFIKAEVNHQIWNSKLRSFILGDKSLEKDLSLSHFDCEFGKWIHSEASQKKYSNSALYQEILVVHGKIHTETHEILAKAKSGADKLILLEHYNNYQQTVNKLINLLRDLKAETLASTTELA